MFAKGVILADDPHQPRGLGSTPFDDEGVANEARDLIDDGVLTTWLLNTSLGPAAGPGDHRPRLARPGRPAGRLDPNLTLQPGDRDLAGLMARRRARACWSPRCSAPR